MLSPGEWSWPESLGRGVEAAWPIYLGYVPIGLAFGVLAQKAGLGPLQVGLMSLLVFAGSSQFIAVSMLGAGAGAPAIVATTFAVNLRHLLMSSALAVHLPRLGRGRLALFGYGVTDESFALNSARFRAGGWHWRPALVVNQTSHAVWVGSTVAGAWAGKLVPAGAFGMDYALIAMFLCLLVFQLQGRRFVLTAAASGILGVMLRLWLPGNSLVPRTHLWMGTSERHFPGRADHLIGHSLFSRSACSPVGGWDTVRLEQHMPAGV